MEHICQTCIKNTLEAKLQKITGIKGKLRKKKKKDVSKKQTNKKKIRGELVAFRTETWKSMTLSVCAYKKRARENTWNEGLFYKF